MLTLSYKINTQPQTDNSYNVYLDIFPDEQKDDLAERLRLKNYHSDGKTNTMEQTFQVDYTTPIGNCIPLRRERNTFFVAIAVTTRSMRRQAGATTMCTMKTEAVSTVI